MREWNNANKCIFDGEYLNGKRWNSKQRIITEFCDPNHFFYVYGEYIKGKEIQYVYLEKTLISQCEFTNGIKNGECKEYYDDGKLKFEGIFKRGKKWDGKGFNEKGNEEYTIKNGTGKFKEYYNNNNLMIEGEYVNGQRNGKIKEYYEFSKLKSEGEYLNGEKNGKFKEYYDNLNLKFEGEYLNGEKNGIFKEYNYDGIIIFEDEYVNGKKNGKSK